ncbi:MAG: tyrosine-type recombinase/integrase [Streptomycetales bacterium]
MAYSHDVTFWKIRVRDDRAKRYQVRWTVGFRTSECSRSFEYRAMADSWRSQLIQAARRGEAFDEETGLPESILREQQSVRFFDLACRFVDLKWPHAAAKTRTAMADALATVTPVLVTTDRGKPDVAALRRVLYGWGFHKTRRETATLDGEDAAALDWLRRHSLKVTVLDEKERRSPLIRAALDTIALQMSGKPAAATTIARKRAVFYGVLNYAVELDILPANPIDKVSWKAPRVAEEVDRRVVASSKQAHALLEAVDADRPELTAFFGCLYYATMRPGEAVALREVNCAQLPDEGWGLLMLSDSAPRVGSTWTDTGTSHDRRKLKHRAKKATRPVPIPPQLVRLIRDHLHSFGTASDGRLFRGHRGGHLSESVYGPVWQAAREKALTPDQVASPLAGRPYDLRHSGVTLALNAGVPAPEIARRAGHSVDVLLRVYAGCTDGQDALWNRRISDALAMARGHGDGSTDIA